MLASFTHLFFPISSRMGLWLALEQISRLTWLELASLQLFYSIQCQAVLLIGSTFSWVSEWTLWLSSPFTRDAALPPGSSASGKATHIPVTSLHSLTCRISQKPALPPLLQGSRAPPVPLSSSWDSFPSDSACFLKCSHSLDSSLWYIFERFLSLGIKHLVKLNSIATWRCYTEDWPIAYCFLLINGRKYTFFKSQCFSNFNVNRNHLGILVKYRFWLRRQ